MIRLITFFGFIVITAATFSCISVDTLNEVVFFTAIDVTTSVPKEHFNQYQDVLCSSILPLMNSGDVSYIMEIDSDPRNNPPPERYALNGTRLEVPLKVRELSDHIGSIRQRPKSYKGTTNIGGVFAFVNEVIETREERFNNAPNNTEKLSCHYVLFILSDGRCDGAQDHYSYQFPLGIKISVYFLGIEGHETKVEEDLLSLCHDSNIESKDVFFVGYRTLSEIGKQIALTLNRAPNPSIVKALAVDSNYD